MTAAEAEIARLRRELEYAIEAARENGKERDELAKALGAEVATTQRLRAALYKIGVDHWQSKAELCAFARAVIANGGNDGTG